MADSDGPPIRPGAGELRRASTPQRVVDDLVVVATRDDGVPLVLHATAARIWTLLDHWTHPALLSAELGQVYPDVDAHEVDEAVLDTIRQLESAGLIERR